MYEKNKEREHFSHFTCPKCKAQVFDLPVCICDPEFKQWAKDERVRRDASKVL